MKAINSVFMLLTGLLSLYIKGAAAQNDRPNFIFIFADDVGFGDLACYGHPYAKTENLDRLATEGSLFRQFHVNGNICPLSRAGIMTGRNPASFPNYTEDYGFGGAVTVTKLLQNAGYRTGHVGKWNIGPDPSADAVEYGIDDLRYLPGSPFDPAGRERRRFDEAIDFIKTNGHQPFYLNIWAMAMHTPIVPPQSFIDQFADLVVDRTDFGEHMQSNFDKLEGMGKIIDETMRVFLADLLALDVHVGRLLDALDELGLADNTIVVFSSDNGPADVAKAPLTLGYAGGLRGGKHRYDEGGTRVPFLVRWPGKVPAGRIDDHSIMFGVDWLTTVCSLAGAEYPQHLLEGEDMSDVWLGNTRPRANPLFFREMIDNGIVYMRYGRWKLHHQQQKLYDLVKDPFEMENVYSDHPTIAAALSAAVKAWIDVLPEHYSRFPNETLPFDPSQPLQMVALPDIAFDDAFSNPVLAVSSTSVPGTVPSATFVGVPIPSAPAVPNDPTEYSLSVPTFVSLVEDFTVGVSPGLGSPTDAGSPPPTSAPTSASPTSAMPVTSSPTMPVTSLPTTSPTSVPTMSVTSVATSTPTMKPLTNTPTFTPAVPVANPLSLTPTAAPIAAIVKGPPTPAPSKDPGPLNTTTSQAVAPTNGTLAPTNVSSGAGVGNISAGWRPSVCDSLMVFVALSCVVW